MLKMRNYGGIQQEAIDLMASNGAKIEYDGEEGAIHQFPPDHSVEKNTMVAKGRTHLFVYFGGIHVVDVGTSLDNGEAICDSLKIFYVSKEQEGNPPVLQLLVLNPERPTIVVKISEINRIISHIRASPNAVITFKGDGTFEGFWFCGRSDFKTRHNQIRFLECEGAPEDEIRRIIISEIKMRGLVIDPDL